MIDLSKPVQTLSGQPVRILCTDANISKLGVYTPIVGIIGNAVGLAAWTAEGRYNVLRATEPMEFDLINVPPPMKKVKVEVRLYRSSRMTTGLAANLGIVAILPGESFGPATPISSATIEMEYPEQP